MSSTESKIRIAIVGGGVAGMIFAIAMARYEQFEINIYEATPVFKITGAGLGLWGEVINICKKLGLEEQLTSVAFGNGNPSFMHLRKGNLQPEGRDMGPMVLSRIMAFDCSALFGLFSNQKSRGTIHFGKRCVSYTQSPDTEEVTIHFKDGSTATCHALIGCDGIHSAVRKELLKELGWKGHEQDPDLDESGLRFTGVVAYRALIDPTNIGDHPSRIMNRLYCGFQKHVVTFPIVGGEYINFVGYTGNPDRHDEWKNGDLIYDQDGNGALREFDGFEKDVQVLFKTANKTTRVALYEVDPLPHWAVGRVALVGDSGHAIPPFIGAGAGQTFEDVYVLAQLLGSSDIHVTRQNILHILRAYEYIRKPRTDMVIECSRRVRRAYQSLGEFVNASDEVIVRSVNEQVRWLWQGSLDMDEEVLRGIKEFKRLEKGV